MKNKLLITLVTAAMSIAHFTAEAQTVGNLRLTKNYFGKVDAIVDEVGRDLGVRFVFDRDHLSKYSAVVTYSDVKTVNALLAMLESSWDMATEIGGDGFIYIARDADALARLMSGNTQAIEQVVEERREARVATAAVKRDFTLTGEVADVASGERIPYASIAIDGTTKGAMTDANGRFTLHGVPADNAQLTVSYIGYIRKFVTLTPSADNPPLLVEIEQQKQQIAEVFVYGRKDDKALEQSVGEQKIKMSPAALKFLPNVGEKDIMRSFQLMPGVSASNENSSGMYVRGGTPDQNLIVCDGFTVYYVDHLYGFYSAFNSNAIKDVQLYKGGFESKWGGRLASVTEITGKDGNDRRVSGGGDLSLLSVNAFLEVPIGKRITTMMAFRRSYQGWLYSRISGQRGADDGTSEEQTAMPSRPGMPGGSEAAQKSYFYDVNGKLTWSVTDRDILSVSVFNGTDFLDNTLSFGFPGGGGGMGGGGFGGGRPNFSMDNSDYTRYGNFGVSGRWTRKMNDRLTSTLVASYSNFYSDRDESRRITVTDDETDEETTIRSGIIEDNSLRDMSLNAAFKYEAGERNTLGFGVFGTYYDIGYSYAQSDTLRLVDKRDNAAMAGVYLQDKIRLANNKLVLTPGVRATWFGNTGKAYVEPRMAASWNFAPRLTLNGATGLYYQFANRVTREDVMSGNTDFWILSGGNDIPVSSSTHLNLGVNYDLPDYLFSVEGYYKRNRDISEYTMRFQRSLASVTGFGGRGGSMEATEEFFTGDGYATGVEFLAQKKAGTFSGWLSYTLGEVKNRFPRQSDKYFPAAQDVTHEFKAVGVYKLGNLDFSATWIYSTGRPYTAPLGGYTLELADGSTETYFAVSDKNNFRLPDYHRLDLAASFRFDTFGSRGRSQSIGVSLFNAYNRKNVSAKKFEVVDGQILESNINYLSITPNVTLSLRF